MNIIKQLHEKYLDEQFEIRDEVMSLNENCLLILESDSRLVCDSAICFLTKFATDIKKGSISKIDATAKKRFAIFTTLELLKDRQAHNQDKVKSNSIHKYLESKKDVDHEELDDIQKTMTGILNKLVNSAHEKGTKVKEDNIALFNESPDKLVSKINKLKAKYVTYSKRV